MQAVKIAYALIALIAAFVGATTASLWNATTDRLGLAVAAAFVVIVIALAILGITLTVRSLKRKRPA